MTYKRVGEIARAAEGDARVAMATLRNAARGAERRRLESIDGEVVAEAVPEARAELRQKNVEMLTPDQHLFHEIIADSGTIEPSDLYEEYRERADDPKCERMLRNYLQKMRRYNLIEAEGATRGRVYRAVSGSADG